MTYSNYAEPDTPIAASIGAIFLSESQHEDETLKKIARVYLQFGYRVQGYIQFEKRGNSHCSPEMFLQDIAEDYYFKISQHSGNSATACRIDSDALTRANARIEANLDKQVDLLILNRFGRSESVGKGVRSVIEKACENEVPVLIPVRQKYLDEWEKYTGGQYQTVGNSFSDIVRWCDEVIVHEVPKTIAC